MPFLCVRPGTTHTPGAQAQITNLRTGATVGAGMVWGSPQCWNCYLTQSTTNSMAADTYCLFGDPTCNYQTSGEGQAKCSMVGTFNSSPLPPSNTHEATTKSKKTGGASPVWTVTSWCTDVSSPPDWNPTTAHSNYDWPYYISISVCSRPASAPAGSPWNCTPNPSALASGSVADAKVNCTNYDKGISGPLWP
jgi:hypothetical protein